VDRMCILKEHISQAGALAVAMDILEVTRSAKPCDPPLSCSAHHPPHPPRAPRPGSEGTTIGQIACTQHVQHGLKQMLQDAHRSVWSRMREKVDLIRSRNINRVQWRLENASLLRERFAVDQPICSTAFQAAGVNGLQFIFYPCGAEGAREGFSSLFLSCPVGSNVRCWLWAGRWRREARAEPMNSHELLGRLNFCRFENCIDPLDDSVELAVEIDGVQQIRREDPSKESVDDLTKADVERCDIATLRSAPARHERDRDNEQHTAQLPPVWTPHGFHTYRETSRCEESTQESVAESPNMGSGGLRPATAADADCPRDASGFNRPRTTANCKRARPRKLAGGFPFASQATVPPKFRNYLQP